MTDRAIRGEELRLRFQLFDEALGLLDRAVHVADQPVDLGADALGLGLQRPDGHGALRLCFR